MCVVHSLLGGCSKIILFPSFIIGGLAELYDVSSQQAGDAEEYRFRRART